jgi:hypothetical protein
MCALISLVSNPYPTFSVLLTIQVLACLAVAGLNSSEAKRRLNCGADCACLSFGTLVRTRIHVIAVRSTPILDTLPAAFFPFFEFSSVHLAVHFVFPTLYETMRLLRWNNIGVFSLTEDSLHATRSVRVFLCLWIRLRRRRKRDKALSGHITIPG